MDSFFSMTFLDQRRYNQRRERSKLRRALGRAEYLSRQEAKNARAKALEEEEAKKIPYEVGGKMWSGLRLECRVPTRWGSE